MCLLTRVRIVKHFKVVGQVRIDVPTDTDHPTQAIINKQDYSAYNSHTSPFTFSQWKQRQWRHLHRWRDTEVTVSWYTDACALYTVIKHKLRQVNKKLFTEQRNKQQQHQTIPNNQIKTRDAPEACHWQAFPKYAYYNVDTLQWLKLYN